ncbi:hypothetical protein GCM10008096_02530 [Zhihengliuella salsuginis]|uniref:Uncharacterized protein n=1 Tax=Zhihengliuella salsuginis TaxID=578222 RepID=A0ABQ3GC33_9MICC|nr:hypothetical protein GCM10008096_02530 [Zhihengliuella salsuginis]
MYSSTIHHSSGSSQSSDIPSNIPEGESDAGNWDGLPPVGIALEAGSSGPPAQPARTTPIRRAPAAEVPRLIEHVRSGFMVCSELSAGWSANPNDTK